MTVKLQCFPRAISMLKRAVAHCNIAECVAQPKFCQETTFHVNQTNDIEVNSKL